MPILWLLLGGSHATAQALAAAVERLEGYGNMTTIELAPVHVAMDQNLYVPLVSLTHGGIPNLHGQANASTLYDAGTAGVATNAETQALRYSVEHPDLRIGMTESEGLYRIIAKKYSDITTLADLKGIKVGTTLAVVAQVFEYHAYPGNLAPDLLDVMVDEEVCGLRVQLAAFHVLANNLHPRSCTRFWKKRWQEISSEA